MKENDQKLIARDDFKVCGIDNGAMVFASSGSFFEEKANKCKVNIIQNEWSLDWTSGVKYLDGIWKPPDDKQKEFEKFIKAHWKHGHFQPRKLEKLIRLMTTINSSMTVHFLLKAILWMKAMMKRMR